MPALDRHLLKIQFSFLLVVLGGRCNQLAVAWWALQESGSALAFANMIACSIAAEVLARTRARLESLEAKVAELEARLPPTAE